jgi:hypothetical protein
MVARRLGAQALLDAAARWLFAGLGVAALLVLAERLLSLGMDVGLVVAAPALASCLAGVSAGLARWPRLGAAAMAADARFGLHERLSTALGAAGGPMASLVCADASRRVAAIDLRMSLPVSAPRFWRAAALGVLALTIAVFMPAMDLLGLSAARRVRAAQRAAVRVATDAALASLGRIAAGERGQQPNRAATTLSRIDRGLAQLLGPKASVAQARAVAERLEAELEGAKRANEAAQRAATDYGRREQLQDERDTLRSAEQVVERWRRDLEGAARSGTQPHKDGSDEKKRGVEPKGAKAHPFVRDHEPVPAPREAAEVESAMRAARAAADAVLRRGVVPPRYRAAVRRYFSRDDELPRPGQ